METYRPYNPDSVVRVEETLPVKNKKIFLRHIPKQGSVVIDGFIECDSLMPAPNQFSCQYALDSLYRDANRVLNFNPAHNGELLTISYIAVGTVITADDMNEIKAHMENGAIHGTHYDLPTASALIKGGVKIGNNLYMDGDTLNASGGLSDVVLDTVPATQDGGLWYEVEDDVPIVYIRYRGNAWRIATKPGTQSGVYFAGVNTNYAIVPLEVLQGAQVFTIEMKISTTDTITGSPCRTLIGVRPDDNMNFQPDFCFGLQGGYLSVFYSLNLISEKTFTAQDDNGFIADGQVHYVAITSSSSGVKLYCDGALVKSGDSSKPTINSNNALRIGWNGKNNAAVCQFELFEARLWSKTRTPEEIFNGSAFANISGDETYLRAWYIPDGSDLMTDYSPNGFDAHIYGLTIGG